MGGMGVGRNIVKLLSYINTTAEALDAKEGPMIEQTTSIIESRQLWSEFCMEWLMLINITRDGNFLPLPREGPIVSWDTIKE